MERRSFGAERESIAALEVAARLATLRLTACIVLAEILSEVFSLQRSYWVALTVAIVMKPDFGSVFARAVVIQDTYLYSSSPLARQTQAGEWRMTVLRALSSRPDDGLSGLSAIAE